ncbi:hypothetical protein KIH87_08320 [Paraneptunicella aestuarii]|uniref:hypothetical protein n=1 Tax=Paraneptunicella aestuarii TaxID=2831148 RepID=UPI001E50371A|nr:hypothetical protein [Paraneptunicella aestuarii]UAA40325.1 hypothetical protein KIH87_08320 [Paraneptunicella aestuarii]
MSEESVKKLLKVTIDELSEQKSSKSLFERLPVITALIAALGSFGGAVVSVQTAVDTKNKQDDIAKTQEKIDKKQKELDDNQLILNERQKLMDIRQIRTDENSRIGRLSYTQGHYCSSIPADDDQAWKDYFSCYDKQEVNTSIDTDSRRLICAGQYLPCNKV